MVEQRSEASGSPPKIQDRDDEEDLLVAIDADGSTSTQQIVGMMKREGIISVSIGPRAIWPRVFLKRSLHHRF